MGNTKSPRHRKSKTQNTQTKEKPTLEKKQHRRIRRKMPQIHNINLSKARTVGRKSRAQKAVSILKKELEKRENSEVKLTKEVNQEIWKRGAEKPPASIKVNITENKDGEKTADLAQIKERDSSSQSNVEIDVTGNVDEVKEEIKEKKEQVDLEKVLEKEKSKKDRKTLKQFIKDLMN